MREVVHGLELLALGATGCVAVGWTLAAVLRRRGLRWSWPVLGLPLVLFTGTRWPIPTMLLLAACSFALLIGALGHEREISLGADFAEQANTRLGILAFSRRVLANRSIRRHGWVHGGRLVVGRDARSTPVSIPAGGVSGSHTLVVGATGSGKTVTQAWVVSRLIEAGHGAIVIDPKGDPLLRNEIHTAATRTWRNFYVWSAEGPTAYNPYAHGSPAEIADKALAGETFTEPHYLRQAQRYLGHAVRTMHAASEGVTPVSLMANLDPDELEVTARRLPETVAADVLRYLDGLGDRQRRELAGVRDRLSILAESETRPWLAGDDQTPELNLEATIAHRAVVYFRLDSDRRPLLTQMLASAVISDLVTRVSHLQDEPVPTVVAIDEFAAVASRQVARLLPSTWSRSAPSPTAFKSASSCVPSTRLTPAERARPNVGALIAHRQSVPESADLVAEVAGSRPAWEHTQQTERGLLGTGVAAKGSRRRGYEFEIHPSKIKRLPTGLAAVITPGSGSPTIASICHADEARTRKR